MAVRLAIMLRVAERFELRDPGRSGVCGVTHPDPQQSAMRTQREGANTCSGRNRVVSIRIERADAVAIESQAVIRALDLIVAGERSARERHEPMRAPIEERYRIAALKAK